jgi:hypothetical protein
LAQAGAEVLGVGKEAGRAAGRAAAKETGGEQLVVRHASGRASSVQLQRTFLSMTGPRWAVKLVRQRDPAGRIWRLKMATKRYRVGHFAPSVSAADVVHVLCLLTVHSVAAGAGFLQVAVDFVSPEAVTSALQQHGHLRVMDLAKGAVEVGCQDVGMLLRGPDAWGAAWGRY